MKFDAIGHTRGNQMLRIGFGQYRNKWFARIDLWFVGFRISQE